MPSLVEHGDRLPADWIGWSGAGGFVRHAAVGSDGVERKCPISEKCYIPKSIWDQVGNTLAFFII